MSKIETPDVFIIGTGPAGGAIAGACSKAGKQVVIADYQPFGGTCPLRGCEPKKFLFDVTNVALRRRLMTERGLRGDISIDWEEMITAMHGMRDPIPPRVEAHYKEMGIVGLHGTAEFVDPDTIAVNGVQYAPKHIVVAAGASSRKLEFPGSELLTSTDDFFELKELPKRIVFIGGGFISFELAHVAAIAGAQVDVVLRSERFLRKFDPFIVEHMIETSKELGVRFHTNLPPCSLSREGNELTLCAGDDHQEFKADCVVSAAGRVADVSRLNVEKSGLELNAKGGVKVNQYMQSVSNPRVYAAGDVVGNAMELTPVATMEGMVAANNIINGNAAQADYSVIPYTLFTHPTVSSVGLREEEVAAAGIPYHIAKGSAAGWASFRRIGEMHPAFKVVISDEDDTVLGATITGHNSEEMINSFAFAMRTKTTIAELRSWLWAYPSFGYEIRHFFK